MNHPVRLFTFRAKLRLASEILLLLGIAANPTWSVCQEEPIAVQELSRTTWTLESLFGSDAIEPDESLPWPPMDEHHAVYQQDAKWVVWCSDPETRATLMTFPISGDFEASARIEVERLENGMLEAGFVGIWNQGKTRYTILKTARGNARVRNDYAPPGENVLGVFSPRLLESFPWIRVRNMAGWVRVFVSADGFDWKEWVKFPSPSKNGRFGLAVFGATELGPRCGVFHDLNLTAFAPGGKVIQIDSGRAPRDPDGNGLPEDYEKLLSEVSPEKWGRSEDADGDGATNWNEYLAHTSPSDPKWRPYPLPELPRKTPGMLLETWPLPANVHAVGATPAYQRHFPQGARRSLAVTSLKNGGFGGQPTTFRMSTEFISGLGGFYQFQLAGVRGGQVTIRELHPDPARPPTGSEEILLSVNGSQRFGSGSIFLKRERFYRLEIVALHRDGTTVPVLNWMPPGASEMVEFAPEEFFLPALDPNDKDRDGLPDDWERLAFGHRYQGAYDDSDRDGLSNIWEWIGGGDPLSADSDGDEFPDLLEDSHGDAIQSNSIQPVRELSQDWNFAWIPPEQKPIGQEDFLPKPEHLPFFRYEKGSHFLLALKNTYRGNRIGWIPFLYREVRGDFDVMTFVDFPASRSETSLFRSAAGGLMVRQAVGGDNRFEVSFSVSNTGELMIKHVASPVSRIKPYYENQYGGDTAWKHQQLWVLQE